MAETINNFYPQEPTEETGLIFTEEELETRRQEKLRQTQNEIEKYEEFKDIVNLIVTEKATETNGAVNFQIFDKTNPKELKQFYNLQAVLGEAEIPFIQFENTINSDSCRLQTTAGLIRAELVAILAPYKVKKRPESRDTA